MSKERKSKAFWQGRAASHVLIVLIAFTIWWSIRQSDSVERTLENAATIEVELDLGEESGNWVVATDLKKDSYTLRLEGPRQENNRFAEDLARLEGGALHRAVIDEEMLEEAKARANVPLKQRVVEIPLRAFEMVIPSDVEREVAVDFAAPDRIVKIALERVVEEDAIVVVGEVVPKEGYTHRLSFTPKTRLRGPFSKLSKMKRDKDGRIELTLPAIDLSNIQDTARTQIMIKRLRLPEAIRIVSGEEEALSELELDVSVAFTRKDDYKQKTISCPIDVLQARWMNRLKVEMPTLADEPFQVHLELDSDSAKYFTEEAVVVVLDLSKIKREDLDVRESEDKKSLSAVIESAPLRVILPSDVELNYRLPEGRTLDSYIKFYNIKLVWAKE